MQIFATLGLVVALFASSAPSEDQIAALTFRAVTDICPRFLSGEIKFDDVKVAQASGFGLGRWGTRPAFTIGEAPDRVLVSAGSNPKECSVGMNSELHPVAFAQFRKTLSNNGFGLQEETLRSPHGFWSYRRNYANQGIVQDLLIMTLGKTTLMNFRIMKAKRKP